MKKQLLTISVITLLMAGQSAMATSENDFTPFDAQAINQVTDNRSNVTTAEAAMPVASYMSKQATDDYYSLDYSHE